MQKRVGRYQMVEEIGKGQYGLVYKAVDLESTEAVKRTVAVKQVAKEKVHKSDLMKRLFVAEVQVMQTLNMKEHDNLLSMLDFIETGNNYYLVVRYCRDGDLETRLKKKKKFNETEAVYFLKQIMNGFTELYKHKIMHRDFKLANVFLDRWVLVIGDFGFAKMGQEMASTKLGTPYNMAPELLLAKGKVPYTSKTDLWSIGNSFNFIFLMGYRDLLLSDALWVFAIRGIYNGRVEKRSRQ
jgi:serine/threonine protein kinase